MSGSRQETDKDGIGPVACRACDLFQICSLIDALPIASGLQRCPTLRTIARGELLHAAGTPGQHVYALRKGILKSEAPRVGDRNRVVALHVPGEVLGREAIARGRYTYDVVAVSPAMVCELPLAPFMRANSELATLRTGFEQLALSGRPNGTRFRGRVRQRLDEFLSELKARLDSHEIVREVGLALRKRELADLLGVHPHSLGRILDELGSNGSIRVEGHRVLIQAA